MLETLKTEIIKLIDNLDESRLHILLGFVKRLLDFND